MAKYIEWGTRGASDLINSRINSIEENSHHVASSSSDLVREIMRNLVSIPEDGSDEEKEPYIKDSVTAVTKFLVDFDFNHPEAAQQVLTDHLHIFDDAADNALYYADVKWVKSTFRQEYAERITEQWTADAAQQFYRIPLLSDPQERVAAAQKWTEQFAAGTASFTQLAERFSIDPQYFSSDTLSSQTLTGFDTYYHQAIEQRGEWIRKIMEQNLGPSDQDLEAIAIKAIKNPHSLSAVDKEIFECMIYAVNSVFKQFPVLEEKKTLLGRCLKLGKSVESASSITEREEFRLVFEQLFVAFDDFLAKHLYQNELSEKEENEPIDHCLIALAKRLENFNFSNLETAQQLADHLNRFDSLIDIAIDGPEGPRIKLEYRADYSRLIMDRWTAHAAQQFYHLLLLSPSQERVAAAQKWTEQFAAGTVFFKELGDHSSIDSKLSKKTQKAFEAYYTQAMLQTAERIKKIVEDSHDYFDENLKVIETKAKENPHSLSANEKEILECCKAQASMIALLTVPCLEEKMELLNNCMKLGKSVESASSITESEESRLAFEQPFIEFDKFLVENLIQGDD